jgi:hypothetical protein
MVARSQRRVCIYHKVVRTPGVLVNCVTHLDAALVMHECRNGTQGASMPNTSLQSSTRNESGETGLLRLGPLADSISAQSRRIMIRFNTYPGDFRHNKFSALYLTLGRQFCIIRMDAPQVPITCQDS